MRHGEGLGERVECTAPGDLPGRDVRDDEAYLEQQFVDLGERDPRNKIVHQEGFAQITKV